MAWFLFRGKHDNTAGDGVTAPRVGGSGDYLGSLESLLTKLDPNVKGEVCRELRSHLRDKAEELESSGLSAEQARAEAARCFGSARLIARQIYDAHSQGTWPQTALAASPHVVFALLFALNFWHDIRWLLFALAAVVSLSAYGWWRGKPGWLFPWLGYLLVPVIFAGVLLLYLPRGLSWIAIILYLPATLWLLIRIGKHTIRRDWIYLSVMLFPVPVLASWVLVRRWREVLLSYSGSQVDSVALLVALSFAALAIGVAAFVRLRRRRLKIGALLALELLILGFIGISSGGPALWVWLLFMLGSVICLLGPALLGKPETAGKSADDWNASPAERYL